MSNLVDSLFGGVKEYGKALMGPLGQLETAGHVTTKILINQIEQSLKNEEYEKVIQFCDSLLEEKAIKFLENDAIFELKKHRGLAFHYLALEAIDGSGSGKIEDRIQDAIDNWHAFAAEYGYSPFLCYYLAELFAESNKVYDINKNCPARNYAIKALGVVEDAPELEKYVYHYYDKLTDMLFEALYDEFLDEDIEHEDEETVAIIEQDKFTNFHNYEERKYIYLARDVNHLVGTLDEGNSIINHVFTLDQYPQDIIFPLGRPTEGVYMAHPVKPNEYYPVVGIDDTLMSEKIREFSWLVQCLGATEIIFHSIKGTKVSEQYGQTMNAEVNGGYDGLNGRLAYGNDKNRTDDRTFSRSIDRGQHFAPTRPPFCPEDLIWLESDPEWQNLVKQRMHGSIVDYTYRISAMKTCMMSNSEKHSVEASVEYLEAKVGGKFGYATDKVFKNEEDTEWSIYVKFAPISQLTETVQTNTLSAVEQEYLDEVKATLEDGEIGPRERKSLERARVRLGISEARAAEIEASVSTPKLTNEEKEYLDEVKAVLEDGEIGPRERKSLERTRNRLGISEERAKEIEKI